MAHLRKVGSGFQIQYYLNGRKHYKSLSKNTPDAVAKAELKRLEADIALHKASIKKFGEDKGCIEFITLEEMTDKVLEAKRHEVADETISRNRYSMQLLMEVLGKDFLVADFKSTHLDQFKNARFEKAKSEYARKGWSFDEDKIKRGINKELENLRTVFRAAERKGIIPIEWVPRIQKLRVDRRRLPAVLGKNNIIAFANQLNGEARLAFWIIRYTGARRGEIARKFVGDDRGLKWKHIDWMRNQIRLYGKKKEKLVPLHPHLRKILLDRKNEIGDNFHPEEHVISFVRDTLSDYF